MSSTYAVDNASRTLVSEPRHEESFDTEASLSPPREPTLSRQCGAYVRGLLTNSNPGERLRGPGTEQEKFYVLLTFKDNAGNLSQLRGTLYLVSDNQGYFEPSPSESNQAVRAAKGIRPEDILKVEALTQIPTGEEATCAYLPAPTRSFTSVGQAELLLLKGKLLSVAYVETNSIMDRGEDRDCIGTLLDAKPTDNGLRVTLQSSVTGTIREIVTSNDHMTITEIHRVGYHQHGEHWHPENVSMNGSRPYTKLQENQKVEVFVTAGYLKELGATQNPLIGVFGGVVKEAPTSEGQNKFEEFFLLKSERSGTIVGIPSYAVMSVRTVDYKETLDLNRHLRENPHSGVASLNAPKPYKISTVYVHPQRAGTAPDR